MWGWAGMESISLKRAFSGHADHDMALIYSPSFTRYYHYIYRYCPHLLIYSSYSHSWNGTPGTKRVPAGHFPLHPPNTTLRPQTLLFTPNTPSHPFINSSYSFALLPILLTYSSYSHSWNATPENKRVPPGHFPLHPQTPLSPPNTPLWPGEGNIVARKGPFQKYPSIPAHLHIHQRRVKIRILMHIIQFSIYT